jgi:DNA-binding phage protein
MEKKSKFTRFDVMDHLTSENIVRLYLESMREDGTEDEIRLAEDDARRACALYGFNAETVGLTSEARITCQVRETVTA